MVNHGLKIKSLGDLHSLTHFVDKKLSLTGSWSFTTSNGGIHVFKADSVTLLFYPGTKTIDLKGAKEETTRKTFLSLLNENSSEIPDNHMTEENGKCHDSDGKDDKDVVILNGKQYSLLWVCKKFKRNP